MWSLGALVWGARAHLAPESSFPLFPFPSGRVAAACRDPAATYPAATHPEKKNNQNSEDPSGSIRDIIAHLINDENTSIAETYKVFNGKIRW